MSAAWVVALHTFRECVRRRVFILVPIASAAFLVLYAIGNHFAFQASRSGVAGGFPVQRQLLVGSSLVGLAMFTILFLASALGIFLTFSVVRGDAETGVLQAVVVRPVARSGLLLGRYVGAAAIAGTFASLLYASALTITRAIGGWFPPSPLAPGVLLVVATVVVISLAVLGSTMLPALPNGIAMFMLYGAGLLAGLLGQLGSALGSPTLRTVGKVVSWALPFEALYQAGLDRLTRDATGLTRFVVRLGPLGGAESGGAGLIAWTIAYIAIVGGLSLVAFARRDL